LEAQTFLICYIGLSLIDLAIAIYVYTRAPSQAVNQAFAFLGAAIGVWTLCVAFAHYPSVSNIVVVRSTFAAASLMVWALFTLLYIFPAGSFPRNRLYYSYAATALAFVALSYTPILVQESVATPLGLVVSYGPMYRAFGIFVGTSVVVGAIVIVRKTKDARGRARAQLWYLIVGLLIPALGIGITNLLVPLLSKSSWSGQYGPALTLIFLGLTAHAIIRYRLMNMRLVVSRTVSYFLVLICSVGTLVAVTEIGALAVPSPTPELQRWSLVMALVLIAALFQPISQFIRRAVDRYLYRRPYDYERTIRDMVHKISTMLELRTLLDYLCDVVGRTVQPERVSVYLRPLEDSDDYQLQAHQAFIDTPASAPPDRLTAASEVAAYFKTHSASLLLDSPEFLLKAPLDELAAECVHPIFDNNSPIGFLVLGPKLSGDPYFKEDISLITVLVNQAAIAIRNAYLHRHVVLVNEYIENILAAMDSGVISVAGDGTVTLFNAAAERLTGLHGEDTKRMPVTKLPEELAQMLQITLEMRRPQQQREFLLTGMDGRSYAVAGSTSILTGEDGVGLGAVAVLSDLSRVKELEGEKLRAERLASIGAFAAGIAHEIKNPLVAIRTFAELLPERFADEDFRSGFAKVVVQEIDRIDGLVSRLRGMAAPRAQARRSIDLHGPISDTIALLRGRIEKAAIAVRTDFESERPMVAGDADQLKQLFLNLFVNALEAMEPGGQLSVRVTERNSRGTPRLVVEVSDTGVGIAEAVVNSLFDPFVTTKERGSGLGLSICRGIVDAHSAVIRAYNNPNRCGATIVVEFPALHALDIPAPTS
jgi:PAS domain S-box-containing protein